MDIYSHPAANEGFVPTTTNEKLADLLIAPDEPVLFANPQQTQKEGEESDEEDVALFYGEGDEENWENLPPRPQQRLNPVKALLRGVRVTLPAKGDKPLRLAGKAGAWLSLVALAVSAVMLIGMTQVAPLRNDRLNEELRGIYNDSIDTLVTDTTKYPAGMLASFKQLYDRNKDVRGWVSFHSKGEDFLNIEYPFVQGEDNQYYRTHDYDGNESRYGTLFVDAKTNISGYHTTDQVLIIRGNNTADQTMLSGMNRLVGPVDYGRVAPELTLSTLYRRDDYYVFATALFDGTGKDPFNPFKTDFKDGEAFLKYIQSLRARSLFDYPVDVAEDDAIVLLAVPTGAVSTGLDDGMLVVAARRHRRGSTETTPLSNQIMKNKNAIMPYSWDIHRGSTPDSFFYNGYVEPTDPAETPAVTIPSTTLVDVNGTTSTTVRGTGNVGGMVVDKNSTTGSTGSTDPTGFTSSTDPTGEPTEPSTEDTDPTQNAEN